jgi:uncharacterized protein YbjT (DUF2867 family)
VRILVTGITGYVGGALAPRLVRDGHELVGLARGPVGPDVARLGVDVVRGDALTGAGLGEALDGADVAYYLIHSMEQAAEGSEFQAREERSATNFAEAAQRAGVGRIVYLGGPVPQDAPISPHLASRLAVERILLEALPSSVALRASVVIGARSRSFRFLVRLVERMPVIPLPVSLTRIASRVGAAIAGEDPEFIGALMGSLGHDLLPRDEDAARLLGVRTHRFDRAVEHALREWEALEPGSVAAR